MVLYVKRFFLSLSKESSLKEVQNSDARPSRSDSFLSLSKESSLKDVDYDYRNLEDIELSNFLSLSKESSLKGIEMEKVYMEPEPPYSFYLFLKRVL